MSRWLVLGLTAGSVWLLAAAQPLTKVVFLTNYAFHGRHAPFFVGVEKGFYRAAGLEVGILPTTGSGFVISALEGGRADYGMAEAAPTVQAVVKGAGVKAFSVFMDATTSGLAGLAPHPVPRSVAGKTIAASLTDSARVILPIVFHLNGLDPARIEWLAADPSIYVSLLLQGRVALVTASRDGDLPALRRVAHARGQTVYFSSFADWGYDVFGYFLVTQAERLASRPDEVRAFAGATARAVRDALDHPEEAARIMVRHNPTLDYDMTLAHWRESMTAMETDAVREHGYGAATPARLQRTIALVRDAFGFDAVVRPDDIFAQGFVVR